MDITCPHCDFSKSVEPSQVPDKPVKVTCPRCKQAFSFDKASILAAAEAENAPEPEVDSAAEPQPEQMSCPACGLTQDVGESCAGCGVVYAKWQARMAGNGPQPSRPAASNDLPERRVICHACGTVQAPAGRCVHCDVEIKPLAVAPEHAYAGFWIRVVAYMIDSTIVGGVQLVLGLLLGFAIGAMGGLTPEGHAAMGMITSLFGAVIGIAYMVFFTGHGGQTPGKMALRIKVIRTDGTEISYGRAALREVPGKFISGILLGIGYLMVAFDDKKQGLHDRIADTYVIKL